MLRRTFALFFLIGTLSASANDKAPDLEWHIFADSYYSYNFNRPTPVTAPNAASVNAAAIPNAQNTYRYYDTYHNQFALSLFELSTKANFGEASVLVDLDFGPFADLNSASTSTSGKSVDEVSKHMGQVVLSYKPEASRFSFDMGKMYSHLGVESVKSKDNYNYSRTVLFSYGLPFWHTGLRANYDAIPELLTASLFVYNGWNSIYDNNNSKSLGAQLKYSPSTLVTLAYNYLGGPERSDSEKDRKTVHEVNSTWSFNDSWSAITDAVLGEEENVAIGITTTKAIWYGGMLGLKYNLNERSYLSPRFEVFRDQHGYILGGSPQAFQSGTLTYGRNLSKGLDLRSEGRWDSSSQKPFNKGLESKDSQVTVLAALFFTY